MAQPRQQPIGSSDSYFLHFSWGNMAYHDTGGEGETVVCLHGTGCGSEDFLPIINEIRQRATYPVRGLALDFRGHGGSATPSAPFTLEDLAADVVTLLDTLQLSHVLLVGHSLGGMVAQEVSSQTSRLGALVLLEGWVSLSAYQPFDSRAHHFGPLAPVEVAKIKKRDQETRARFNPAHFQSFWHSVEAFDGTKILAGPQLPILHIYGGAGSRAETWKNLRVPSNQGLHVIDSAGHFLPIDSPTEVADLCLLMLGTLHEQHT